MSEPKGEFYAAGTYYHACIMSSSQKVPIGINISMPTAGSIFGLDRPTSSLAFAEKLAEVLNSLSKDTK